MLEIPLPHRNQKLRQLNYFKIAEMGLYVKQREYKNEFERKKRLKKL